VPGFPGFHTLVVLLVTVLALYAFTRDKWPLEATGLAILVVLILTFQLFPYERGGAGFSPQQLLSGFGNEALVAICALMVLGKGMETTGALRPVAVWLAKVWTRRPRLALLLTLTL